MQQIILIIHFLVAVVLIILVLVQRGKGADIGAAFGSGASSTVFGSKGSGGFLMKLTFSIAAIFFITSIGLTYLAAKQARTSHSKSILTGVEQFSKAEKQAKQPATTKKVLPTKKTAINKTKPK